MPGTATPAKASPPRCSFVKETGEQAIGFYEELVENLRPWQAPAPKTHSGKAEGEEEVGPARIDEDGPGEQSGSAGSEGPSPPRT